MKLTAMVRYKTKASRTLTNWRYCGAKRTKHQCFELVRWLHVGNLFPEVSTMIANNPKLFVASSREALPFAKAIQTNLRSSANVTVWDQGAIHPGETVIDALIRNCAESQFGIFVIAPDDQATIRDSNVNIVRDNVILEMGMFMGRLGKERSFLIMPDQPLLHLPREMER